MLVLELAEQEAIDPPPKPIVLVEILARVDAVGQPAHQALSGRISLAAGNKAAPEDTVFVFARPADGRRMPVAILRRQARDLPFDFTLDDSMAMNPTVKLSDFAQVVVVARVSKTGQAGGGPGDIEAASAAITPGTRNIKLEIGAPARP
jgi:cytochrome c-type biogenesis protein CcmH